MNIFPVEPKAPREYFAVGADFGKRLSDVTAATVTVVDLNNVDVAPASLLNGDAQCSGAWVYQRINPGVSGARYEISIFAEGVAQSGYGEGYECKIILAVTA